MFGRLADSRNANSLAVKMRARRFALFQHLLARLPRPVTILDIGGTEEFWKMMGYDGREDIFLTLLNLEQAPVTLLNVRSVAGDARHIQMEDKCVDVVFSNSVIEHVGNFQAQREMAHEALRIGRRYFIQTPNRNFPLEPHFLFPFFQFLPVSIRVFFLRRFTLGWIPRTPDALKARELVEGIRLLTKREFAQLFPSASIYEERLVGLVKSFVAYGGWE